ncbi:MAG: amino acid adenylation domain-containing protein [Mariprofundaceae bacterium]
MLVIDSLLKHQHHESDHIAFNEGDRNLDYHNLFTHAKRASHVLLHHGIKPGDRIALLLPRGIDAACCIYGILFTGACYVPLDIQNPKSRLSYIIRDVRPKCILGRGNRPEWCDHTVAWLDINDPDFFAEKATEEIHDIPRPNPENIAAVLYTSGSSGSPKGVAISGRAIDAFVIWSATTFSVTSRDRIASLAPFHFDLSLFDLFTAVHCGARTCFVPQTLTLAPKKLVDWLEAMSITAWYTVPSILVFLTMRGNLGTHRLQTMKRILFAGEIFPLPSLKKLANALPHTELYNLFGPTETNVCAYWHVDRARLNTMEAIPIGKPACKAKLMIHTSGELWVKSSCVMSGYWQQGSIQEADQGWHHTGDRVSYNDQGELQYHGRIDRMIKSSGYRIEPAEIEAVINRFEHVHDCVVIGESDPISGNRLVAAVVSEGLEVRKLRTHLKDHLATYMQPYRFVQLDTLPLLSNGKVDYRTVEEMI